MVMLKSSIYEPSTLATDSSSDITRADTVIYSSTSPDSALYIAPWILIPEGSTLKSYRTNNQAPTNSRLTISRMQVLLPKESKLATLLITHMVTYP